MEKKSLWKLGKTLILKLLEKLVKTIPSGLNDVIEAKDGSYALLKFNTLFNIIFSSMLFLFVRSINFAIICIVLFIKSIYVSKNFYYVSYLLCIYLSKYKTLHIMYLNVKIMYNI